MEFEESGEFLYILLYKYMSSTRTNLYIFNIYKKTSPLYGHFS